MRPIRSLLALWVVLASSPALAAAPTWVGVAETACRTNGSSCSDGGGGMNVAPATAVGDLMLMACQSLDASLSPGSGWTAVSYGAPALTMPVDKTGAPAAKVWAWWKIATATDIQLTPSICPSCTVSGITNHAVCTIATVAKAGTFNSTFPIGGLFFGGSPASPAARDFSNNLGAFDYGADMPANSLLVAVIGNSDDNATDPNTGTNCPSPGPRVSPGGNASTDYTNFKFNGALHATNPDLNGVVSVGTNCGTDGALGIANLLSWGGGHPYIGGAVCSATSGFCVSAPSSGSAQMVIAIAPLPPPTPTNTPTVTATVTNTFNTYTPTRTGTATATGTNTGTATRTGTNTATRTETLTPTVTPTRTETRTATLTRTGTQTPTRTPSYTATATSTVTQQPKDWIVTDKDGRSSVQGSMTLPETAGVLGCLADKPSFPKAFRCFGIPDIIREWQDALGVRVGGNPRPDKMRINSTLALTLNQSQRLLGLGWNPYFIPDWNASVISSMEGCTSQLSCFIQSLYDFEGPLPARNGISMRPWETRIVTLGGVTLDGGPHYYRADAVAVDLIDDVQTQSYLGCFVVGGSVQAYNGPLLSAVPSGCDVTLGAVSNGVETAVVGTVGGGSSTSGRTNVESRGWDAGDLYGWVGSSSENFPGACFGTIDLVGEVVCAGE